MVLFLLVGLLFLLGGGFGLLAFAGFLFAEDGLIALGEFLGLGEADTNDTHENYPPYWCEIILGRRIRPCLSTAQNALHPCLSQCKAPAIASKEPIVMPPFRKGKSANQKPTNIAEVIAEMFRPAHFFLGPELELEWDYAEQELVWEVFQGRLLDPAHTRQLRSFAAWRVYGKSPQEEGRPSEPLVALYLDAAAGLLHVVRGLDSYVWEGYDAGGNVYLSRERRKWVRELVYTLRLDRFADAAELRDELACALFLAVVGTSRLPLSSVETPLPQFSFGQLFYCYRPDAPLSGSPVRGWRGLLTDMLAPQLNPREQAHLLETFLHAVPDDAMRPAAAALVRRWMQCGRTIADLPVVLRTLFNHVSLSPYTDLVTKTLGFLHALEDGGYFSTEQVVDFLSFLLRHIGRHLTAFDLVLFHHRGANYPDALLLDAVLKEYLAILDRRPDLFLDAENDDENVRRRKRIRRRALRQGWLLRRRYEGHAVPDLPTSPGENMRVLPPSHPRVPEEQITQPARRSRQLYAGDPLLPRLGGRAAEGLRQSFHDLESPDEWRELGLAVFLDRPLGEGKAATEPDGTLLLSAEAFSPCIARQRLLALAGDVGIRSEDACLQRLLARPPLPGLPLDAIGGPVRPGTISLADAGRASADFVFLRSTPNSVKAFLAQFDFTPLAQRFSLDGLLRRESMLIARSVASGCLVSYDARLRPRVELAVAAEKGFEMRAGQEYPLGGLRVLRLWQAATDGDVLHLHDLRNEAVSLPPRDAFSFR
jgi:hypothetical protein